MSGTQRESQEEVVMSNKLIPVEERHLTPEQVAASIAERNRLAKDRQTLSDGLTHVEREMRDTAKELAPGCELSGRDRRGWRPRSRRHGSPAQNARYPETPPTH